MSITMQEGWRSYREITFYMKYDVTNRTLQEPDNIDMQVIYDLKPTDLLVVYIDTTSGIKLKADDMRSIVMSLREKYNCKVIALPRIAKICLEDKESMKHHLQWIIKYLDE